MNNLVSKVNGVLTFLDGVLSSQWTFVPKRAMLSFAVAGFALLGLMVIVDAFVSPSFNYKGKHVVITGGSSGIGLEIARECLKKGAKVTIVARDQGRLDQAAASLSTGVTVPVERIATVSLDTSSDAKVVSTALAASINNFGEADVLINCAGTSIAAEFGDLSVRDFERMYKVNVLGSVIPTQVILEGMKKKGKGRIIFVSSQVAQAAIHGYTAYAASKWALRGIAEALQMEVKPYGIYVSVAYPPDTDTPGYKTEMETKPAITKMLSESGAVFQPSDVARDILNDAARGYFGISNGLDGWLLKQLHPGMTPCNNVLEVMQSVLFTPLCRFIALFYLISWDQHVRANSKPVAHPPATKKSQ